MSESTMQAAIQADREREIRMLGIPTIQDRLTKAIRTLAVIEHATRHPSDTHEYIDRDAWAAIHDGATDAKEEMFWLSELPADVLSSLAPNGDQARDLADITAEADGANGGAQ